MYTCKSACEDHVALTANPIVPRPKTATVDPWCTLQIFHADPTPWNSMPNTTNWFKFVRNLYTCYNVVSSMQWKRYLGEMLSNTLIKTREEKERSHLIQFEVKTIRLKNTSSFKWAYRNSFREYS